MDFDLSEAEEADRVKNCLGKMTWATKELAAAASSYAQWQYGGNSGRIKPYRCKYCDKWHLASA
jgi:hypothetical protein